MNDRAQEKPDSDAEFARELERKHDFLMASERHPSSLDDLNESEQGARIHSAMRVLELLEEINTDRRNTPGPTGDTVNDPSTRANSGGRTGIGSLPEIESLIPDLRKLGRFGIVEQIGRGGFGIVVRAFDPQLQRDVAIKIPRFETALSTESRARFDREAKAAAALNHPGVVAVFETCTELGIDFIVTELVEGDNLATLLARGQKFSAQAAAEMVAQLADAVEHAHQRGILHRDIKPSNILIEGKPNGLAKIADFGLASIVDQHDFTQSGAVVGTPAFMAPEQAVGNRGEIGPPADVYGLGAVLYQLLTGVPPFGGRSIVETLKAIAVEDPQSPRGFDPSIPKDLEAICLKCLEKKPAARYASARDLQADLNRFVNHLPVDVRRINWLDRTGRWVTRNRGLATLSISLFLVLVCGLVTTLVLWRFSEGNRLLAEQNQTKYQIKAEQLEGVIDGMFDRIRQMPEIGLQGMDPVRETMLADVNQHYSSLLSETPGNPMLRQKHAETILRLAGLKSSLADDQGAVKILTRWVESNPPDGSAFQVQQRIDALISLANSYGNLRQTDQQNECYEEAVSTARSAYVSVEGPSDNDRIEFAKTLSEAADIVSAWGDRTLGNQLALESIGIWEEVSDEDVADNATVLALGKSYLIAAKTHAASEDRSTAREFSKQGIELLEQTLDERVRNSPKARFLLADGYYALGASFRTELSQAIPHFNKALLIVSDLSTAHPLVPGYQQKMGSINYQRGLTHYVAFLVNKLAPDRDDHLTTSLPIFLDNVTFLNNCRNRYPDDATLFEPILASSVTMTGLIYGEQKDYENQLVALGQSLSLAQEIHDQSATPKSWLRVLGITGNLGYPLMQQQNYAQAIEKFQAAIAGLEQMLQDDPGNGTASRYLSGDLEYLAECFAAVDRHEDALDSFRKSMQAYREDNPEKMMGTEAFYLVGAGDVEQAQTRFDRFVTHQIGIDSLSEIVVCASQVISAIDGQSESDQSTVARSLLQNAAKAAVDALGDLYENPDVDDADVDRLLADPGLLPLKSTETYRDWIERRQ